MYLHLFAGGELVLCSKEEGSRKGGNGADIGRMLGDGEGRGGHAGQVQGDEGGQGSLVGCRE